MQLLETAALISLRWCTITMSSGLASIEGVRLHAGRGRLKLMEALYRRLSSEHGFGGLYPLLFRHILSRFHASIKVQASIESNYEFIFIPKLNHSAQSFKLLSVP